MNRYDDSCIIIFAKAPVPGLVKTRLMPAIGADAAATLHRFMVEQVVTKLGSAQLAPVQLWCSPDCHHPLFVDLQHRLPIELHTQIAGNLGERMLHAFSHVLSHYQSAVIVGTDCAVLDADHIELMLAAMHKDKEAAIISAEDGGYVGLGLKQANEHVFEKIAWGSDQVFKQTTARFRKLYWRYQQWPALWDIDRLDDLKRLRAHASELSLSREFQQFLSGLKFSATVNTG